MEALWTIISNGYKDLPAPVKVTVYLLVLLTTLYLLLLPLSIHGYVFFKDENGGKHPYRGAELLMSAGGHDYKYLVNEDGWFTVPVVSKLPTKTVKIGLVHKETGGLYDVDVNVASLIWLDDCRIEVTTNPAGFKLAAASIGSRAMPAVATALEWLAAPALAQKLVLPNQAVPLPAPEAQSVKQEVRSAITGVAKVPAARLGKDFAFAQDLSYTQKIQVIERMEATYRIRVPDEHWTKFRTLGEVEDYFSTRLALEQARPQGKANWPEYQKGFDEKLFK